MSTTGFFIDSIEKSDSRRNRTRRVMFSAIRRAITPTEARRCCQILTTNDWRYQWYARKIGESNINLTEVNWDEVVAAFWNKIRKGSAFHRFNTDIYIRTIQTEYNYRFGEKKVPYFGVQIFDDNHMTKPSFSWPVHAEVFNGVTKEEILENSLEFVNGAVTMPHSPNEHGYVFKASIELANYVYYYPKRRFVYRFEAGLE